MYNIYRNFPLRNVNMTKHEQAAEPNPVVDPLQAPGPVVTAAPPEAPAAESQNQVGGGHVVPTEQGRTAVMSYRLVDNVMRQVLVDPLTGQVVQLL
jgi:hypothetical protein